MTPLGVAVRGLLAGAAGTAAMTAWQTLASRLEGSRAEQSEEGGGERDPWESAPAPAQVAKRVIEGLFRREVGADKIGLLTNVTHWGYGTAWGAVYGLVQGSVRANPLAHGLVFGSGVWAMSYVELVPMGLYEPPWRYPAQTVAKDISYHLVYGVGVAAAYEAVARRR
jgi:hypothetical protein